MACLLFAPAGVPASVAAEVAARVTGAEITRAELETAGDEAAQVVLLREWVWERIYAHYVAEHGLSATAREVAELLAYHREFDRRDRLQRTRKLAELNERLAREDLDAAERARLDEFRAALVALARREAANDHAAPESADEPAAYAPWIEFWKGNRALYEAYGGTVGLTSAGPAAYGARVALIADYERRGLVQFPDAHLRARLMRLMSRPPGNLVPPQEVDFTPYWRRPIPGSYYPDGGQGLETRD